MKTIRDGVTYEAEIAVDQRALDQLEFGVIGVIWEQEPVPDIGFGGYD